MFLKNLNLLTNLLLFSLILDCSSKQIGSGYTLRKKSTVYNKPMNESKVILELKSNSYFDITEIIHKNDSLKVKKWYRIIHEEKIGYIEDNKYSYNEKDNLFFLKVNAPSYGMVIATSLILRSEPSTSSKQIERLSTKEIVEILEDGLNQDNVNGKKGLWAKVKTKSSKIGYVFTPYLVRSDSLDKLNSLESYENEENSWIYINNEPKFIYIKEKEKLKKISNDQVKENEFYLIKSRFIGNDGMVYFNIVKMDASLEDWYSEIQYDYITNCYISAKNLQTSNSYSVLYSIIKNLSKSEKKIFQMISENINFNIDPYYSKYESFSWKDKKYHVLITSHKNDYESCNGCFEEEKYNIVFVFEETKNNFEKILDIHSSRQAEFENYDIPTLIISDSPPIEGDEDPSKITTRTLKFKSGKFD